MNITRDTYESYFIDYLDQNLTDKQLRTLVDFLDQNPDLELELKEMTSFSKQQNTIQTEDQAFEFDKTALIKSSIFDEDLSNFDELCISFYEGLLNDKEEQYLLELTDSRSELLNTFETYGHTQAKANLSITFPNKNSLKQHKKIALHQYFSYAASLIFVLGFIFYIQDGNQLSSEENTVQFANNNTSYMDYPKVSFFEEKAQITLSKEPFKKKPVETKNNIKTEVIESSIAPIEDEQVNKAIRKIITIPADYFNTEDNNLEDTDPYDNSIYYSRKGKLAYNSLTDLEKHLAKVFKDKKIDKSSIRSEMLPIEQLKKNDIKTFEINPLNNYNNPIQLATSIDPNLFQKRILGSQPIK